MRNFIGLGVLVLMVCVGDVISDIEPTPYTDCGTAEGKDLGISGTVVSPLYPYQLYPHNARCRWLINLPEHQLMKITVTDLEIEEGAADCSWDGIYFVTNVTICESQIEAALCGNHPYGTYSETFYAGPVGYIDFHSDGSKNNHGFSLEYEAVAAACLAPEPLYMGKTVFKNPAGDVIETPRKNYRFGATAEFSCNEGGTLIGTSSITCQDSGDWSGDIPGCSFCGLVPNVEMASEEYFDVNGNALAEPEPPFVPGSKVKFMCEWIFRATGVTERTCEQNGRWSDVNPICKRVCFLLPLDHGIVTYEDVSTAAAGLPITTFGIGTVATYACDEGRLLIDGPESRTCQADGFWTGTDPADQKCIKVCMPQAVPQFATLSYVTRDGDPAAADASHHLESAVLTYSCDPNVSILDGQATRTCSPDGEWDGVAPTCKLVCFPLAVDPNGAISFESTSGSDDFYDLGDVATYTCDVENNWGLIGNGDLTTRTCEANADGLAAAWSGSDPECILVCPILPSIDNGVISYTHPSIPDGRFDHGTIANYTCDYHHFLYDYKWQVCKNGVWFGEAPTCEMICFDVAPVLNAELTYTITHTHTPNGTHKVGSEVWYHCDDTWTVIDGNEERMCMISGEYNGTDPLCRYPCLPLTAPVNGALTYAMDGESATFEPASHFGVVASFTCDYGYELEGSATQDCTEEGFTNQTPTCPKICGDVPAVEHATVVYTSTHPDDRGDLHSLGSTATYVCDPTLTNLEGTAMRTCVDGGVWDVTELPTCVYFCLPLDEPVDSTRTYAVDDVDVPGTPEAYVDGTVASFECNKWSEVRGVSERHCSNVGWSDENPTCFRGEVCKCEEDLYHCAREDGDQKCYKQSTNFDYHIHCNRTVCVDIPCDSSLDCNDDWEGTCYRRTGYDCWDKHGNGDSGDRFRRYLGRHSDP